MNTREFYIRVEDGVPMVLHHHDGPPTADERSRLVLSYWALGADAYGDFPPVLMHIYCAGLLPSDEARDGVNAAVTNYVSRLLTGQA